MEEMRDYKPIQPRGGGPSIRKALERIGGLAVLIGGTALKWGFIFVKFFGFFISVAAYTLWFHSWTFALGFVLMILVHELGHAAEARRQGLEVSAPMFIPFIGAYVKIRHAGLTPWRNALISLAGPAAGGGAAAVAVLIVAVLSVLIVIYGGFNWWHLFGGGGTTINVNPPSTTTQPQSSPVTSPVSSPKTTASP